MKIESDSKSKSRGFERHQVLDGPYADTKEQLGGFHVIEVADLDAALSWAARCPTALHGVVEVRPLQQRSLADFSKELGQ